MFFSALSLCPLCLCAFLFLSFRYRGLLFEFISFLRVLNTYENTKPTDPMCGETFVRKRRRE